MRAGCIILEIDLAQLRNQSAESLPLPGDLDLAEWLNLVRIQDMPGISDTGSENDISIRVSSTLPAIKAITHFALPRDLSAIMPGLLAHFTPWHAGWGQIWVVHLQHNVRFLGGGYCCCLAFHRCHCLHSCASSLPGLASRHRMLLGLRE